MVAKSCRRWSVIDEMLQGVTPWTGNWIVVSIRVFIDDSLDKSQRASFLAGYMGSVKETSLFEDRWTAALVKQDVACFHSRDFFHRHGKYVSLSDGTEHKYADWSDTRKSEFLTDLTDAINNSRLRRVGSYTDVTAFNALAYGERRHLTGGNFNGQKFTEDGAPTRPYFLNWQACLIQANDQAIADAEVLFVFSRDDNNEPRALAHFAEILKHLPRFRGRFGNIVYQAPIAAPALQAADLFVYSWCRAKTDHGLRSDLQQQAIEGVFKRNGWHSEYDAAHMDSTLNTIPDGWHEALRLIPDPSRRRREKRQPVTPP